MFCFITLARKTSEKPKQSYTCETCGYVTMRRGDYNKHILIHSGIKPYHCPLCNYKTTEKCRLNRHLESKLHTGEPRVCNSQPFSTWIFANKSFSTLSDDSGFIWICQWDEGIYLMLIYACTVRSCLLSNEQLRWEHYSQYSFEVLIFYC